LKNCDHQQDRSSFASQRRKHHCARDCLHLRAGGNEIQEKRILAQPALVEVVEAVTHTSGK